MAKIAHSQSIWANCDGLQPIKKDQSQPPCLSLSVTTRLPSGNNVLLLAISAVNSGLIMRLSCGRWLATLSLNLFAALTSLVCVTASKADVLYFSDNFNYANGNLAGNNGGTGWASAWLDATPTPTGNLVANPLPGTVGNSVQISNSNGVTQRTLTSPISTSGGNSYYLSFLFNAAPYQTGGNAGLTLSGTGTSLFVGMPGGGGKIGFDWTGYGTAETSYNPSDNINYLIMLKIERFASVNGYAKATLWATTDLLMNGSALEAQGSSLVGSIDNNGLVPHSDINVEMVKIGGTYSTGSINLSGLAMASTANEAVNFTHTAVPEPGTLLLGSLAATLGGCGYWRNRRKKTAPAPVPAA